MVCECASAVMIIPSEVRRTLCLIEAKKTITID